MGPHFKAEQEQTETAEAEIANSSLFPLLSPVQIRLFRRRTGLGSLTRSASEGVSLRPRVRQRFLAVAEFARIQISAVRLNSGEFSYGKGLSGFLATHAPSGAIR